MSVLVTPDRPWPRVLPLSQAQQTQASGELSQPWSFLGGGVHKVQPALGSQGMAGAAWGGITSGCPLAGVAWSLLREVVMFIIANVISRPAMGDQDAQLLVHHGDPCDGWPSRLTLTGLACLPLLVRPLTFH